ncbi:saponin hydrolase precursor [Dactylonectria macrodidyma]|uniref:Saponin hydrolase n=1 Tax=Dactylonectria macrodidyma TaxID=307937 RepID=A0A9P9IFX2_9HYPO|nr:saponin hydrolase precursor [Dactylonectria macrodidyma]
MRVSSSIIALAASFQAIAGHTLPQDPGSEAKHLERDLDPLPPPPKPEPITVTELPLPPVAEDRVGACTTKINPRRTGCIKKFPDLMTGNFLPDNRHVVASVNYAGAPASGSGSIYSGPQLIIIKTDGKKFGNGDAWKCITCGVPEKNRRGMHEYLDYPQAFRDGKRILAGANIIKCTSPFQQDSCTPDKVKVHPIHWYTSEDGSGPSGSLRELRIHPDNKHLAWSWITTTAGKLDQYGFVGRLRFNRSPKVGEPKVPRYDLENVQLLFDPSATPPIAVHADGKQLVINHDAITVGELRGFTGTGRELHYVGFPTESSNIDVYAVDLLTGKVRRLTQHPEYVDPIDFSADDKWMVIEDTRGSDRQMFIAGLRGIPPVTDLVSSSATSSTRNNGYRRFFQPWLLDGHGDRGSYFGQQINAGYDATPGSGSPSDPEWNSMADPKFSWDGTQIAWFQSQTVSPACGGHNPLPCYPSTAQGGRQQRLMLAHMTSRKPVKKFPAVQELPQTIPWAIKYKPGFKPKGRPFPPPGEYVLKGQSSGYANVALVGSEQGTLLRSVGLVYHDFSDDGLNVLTGSEKVDVHVEGSINWVDWHSNLTQTGPFNGTKKTSPDGFQLRIDVRVNEFMANGSLVTTVDGKEYFQPLNFT